MRSIHASRLGETATLSVMLLAIASCGGGHDNNNNTSYPVTVTVAGLAGSGLVIQNNGANDLAISANGSSTIGTLANNSAYNITVKTQPTNPVQTCTATNPSGTVQGAGVTVTVNCATNTYAVGGAVTGLAGSGLVLSLGSENLPITANGSFAFSTKIASGQTYNVAIASQPSATPAQNCIFTNGSATGVVQSADLTTVQIACANVSRFLYVTSSGDSAVIGYSIDASSGALTPLASGSFPTGAAPGPVIMTPDNKFAYVLNRGDHTVSMFSVDDTTGNWAAITGSPLSVDAQSQTITIHPSGKFAYVTSTNSGTGLPVTVYSIDATTGVWTASPGGPMSVAGKTPMATDAFTFDPNGQFAYSGNDVVQIYSVNPVTGFFTAIATTPASSSVVDFSVITPNGKFLYGTGGFGSVSGFSIDSATGSLTALSGSPYGVGGSENVAQSLDPGGNFLYTTDCDCKTGWNAPGLLFGATLNGSTGAATQIPASSSSDVLAQVGIDPGRLVFEASGKFAYTSSTAGQGCTPGVAGSGTAQIISGFTVDASGKLIPIPGSPFTVGSKTTDCWSRSPVTLK